MKDAVAPIARDFPSFSEGLSLRHRDSWVPISSPREFPFLFGGTFIEAKKTTEGDQQVVTGFPFLFGGTFIEAR